MLTGCGLGPAGEGAASGCGRGHPDAVARCGTGRAVAGCERTRQDLHAAGRHAHRGSRRCGQPGPSMSCSSLRVHRDCFDVSRVRALVLPQYSCLFCIKSGDRTVKSIAQIMIPLAYPSEPLGLSKRTCHLSVSFLIKMSMSWRLYARLHLLCSAPREFATFSEDTRRCLAEPYVTDLRSNEDLRDV